MVLKCQKWSKWSKLANWVVVEIDYKVQINEIRKTAKRNLHWYQSTIQKLFFQVLLHYPAIITLSVGRYSTSHKS